jgi:hypothetical protein
VIGLDGTPTRELWELALGEPIGASGHVQVLTDDEREAYITEALDLTIVRTSEHVKPYNCADHVDVDGDLALLRAIEDQHDQPPAVITSTTALEAYDETDQLALERDGSGLTGTVVDGPASSVNWYGNVLGSNRFNNESVGAVIGSNHYGDDYVERWAGFAGATAARDDGKGAELSYGAFGDRVLTHMREHDTLQAALRFGRDGRGATVYIHTDTLPEWVPVHDEGRVVRTRSNGERQVLTALQDLLANDVTRWRTNDVTVHDAVEISERHVRNVLQAFVEEGVLSRERQGRGYIWTDEGLAAVDELGEVELPDLEADDCAVTEVRETARMGNSYTWGFRNSEAQATSATQSGGLPDESVTATGDDGGDRPPDDDG